MPRGMHPNSRKALEENRHKGGINAENAVELGKKSAESKRRRKTFREEFEAELAATITDAKGQKTTVKNAITKMAVQKAIKGDLRALEFIRDTIGEKPIENILISEVDPDVVREVEAIVRDEE